MRPSRLRRLIQWPLQFIMIGMARVDLFVARGLHPSDRISADKFLGARYWSIATDYVRNATLELVAREVSSIPGSVAELGVYEGDFAALIHAHLPDRTLHLFDTFRGFDARDRVADNAQAYAKEYPDFSDTSIEAVRRLFPREAQLVFHPGWFPQTTVNVPADERFALISLDADLYQPMIEGLNWFWERMTPGGYILVNDYNNRTFSGTKAAVREFAARVNVSYCPIPDWGGTAIIGKPRITPPVTAQRSELAMLNSMAPAT